MFMDEKEMNRYKKIFKRCNEARPAEKVLTLSELVTAIKMVNHYKITDKEIQFCLMALDLIQQSQPRGTALIVLPNFNYYFCNLSLCCRVPFSIV